MSKLWQLKIENDDRAVLFLKSGEHCLAQLDCQHRLGELSTDEVSLAFMAFVGLDLRTEMALFNVINTKASGLSTYLTYFNESNLLASLAQEAPHLYISRKLNEESNSPWYKMIRYGGETTSGLKRRTSLRMMQRSVHRFLKSISDLYLGDISDQYEIIVTYWRAVKKVFPKEWEDHRHHLLTKGIGLYSLMTLLPKLVRESNKLPPTEEYYISQLSFLKYKIDWKSTGTFSNAEGQKGAQEAYRKLRELIIIK